jgi:hypothetical protein
VLALGAVCPIYATEKKARRCMTFKPPKWQKPNPLGFGAAVNSTAYVAAPLLAGFSVATIGVITTSEQSFRWPGATLVCLTVAAILLIASLQLGIVAQKYFTSGADYKAWWTEEEITRRQDEFSENQEYDFRDWLLWAAWATVIFYLGIAVLAAGLATLLAPLTSENGALASGKWTGFALLVVAAVIEVVVAGVSGTETFSAVLGERPKKRRK